MTREEAIRATVDKLPDAVLLAWAANKAALMPIIPDVIIHGTNEALYTGPREEIVLRPARQLSQRLDR